MKRLQHLFLVVNESKPAAVQAALEAAAWCKAHGIACSSATSADAPSRDDVVCALGGDGTVLRAAALAVGSEAAVLGVNVGSLGFLSQTSLEGLFPALEHLARGDYEIEERMRLHYRAADIEGTALNDLFVASTGPRLLDLILTWNGSQVANFHADGLVFSTPTGATAYSLSLGGPVVVPAADCLVVTPHAAHVLGSRPIVFAAGDKLQMRASAPARLAADGDEVGGVPAGTEIVVRRAETPTRLVRAAGAPGFFATLTRKLNWPSVDPRGGRSGEAG